MKRYFILLFSLAFFACGKESKNEFPVESAATLSNQELAAQLKQKDSVIGEFMQSFSEIQENLEAVKSKEHIVTVKSKEQKLSESSKDQIISDIKLIDGLLKKNREELEYMHENLKKHQMKIAELDMYFPKLRQVIDSQEREINSLKDSLNKLHILIDALSNSMTKEDKELKEKIETINTGYCAIGTHKELLDQGIIEDKGGVAGVGATEVLSSKLSLGFFSKMDIYGNTEVTVAASKVTILSNHPKNSYLLEDTKLRVKKLVITDPDSFWSTSKFLIIEVSADTPAYYQGI